METMKESPEGARFGRTHSISLALMWIDEDLPWPVLPT
jgi:hypothetical protein